MTDDIVAELDRWLDTREWEHARGTEALLRRARDEIVALRRYKLENDEALGVIRRAAALVETTPKVSEAKRLIRDEALEEAARVCEGGYTTGSTASTLKAIAAAIRALKT